MNRATTWIGGATAAVVLALGAAFFTGQSLEARDAEGTATWLTADDVLNSGDLSLIHI